MSGHERSQSPQIVDLTFESGEDAAAPLPAKAPRPPSPQMQRRIVTRTPCHVSCSIPTYPRQVSVLTWNTSSQIPSCQAVDPSNASLHQQAGIARVIEEHRPDIVCLQELQPRVQPSVEEILVGSGSYLPNKSMAFSHCGYSTILIRSGVGLSFLGKPRGVGPANLSFIQVEHPNAEGSVEGDGHGCTMVAVASCHLQPFKDGAARRFQQMKRLKEACIQSQSVPCRAVIIAGDMNMRQDEDKYVEVECELSDCWVKAGRKADNKFTWDTTRNHYYKDGPAYKARYDRIYFSGDCVKECHSLQLVGDQPVGGNKHHFLSDHFGLMAAFSLQG